MSKDNNKKTPKVRFPGFDGDWEERKFGDLADYKKGPFGSAITKDMFVQKSEESIKVYEQQNAINKDWKLERYFLPKEYALTKLKSFEVHGGDIIVSCAGTIGEIYEIPENADTGIINQALMRVRVDEYCVDKKMFKIVFSNMIDDFTRVHSNGSAIKNIPPFSDLKPMGVLLPSLQEQEKISSYFENLDHLITLHQRKLEKLKEYKKGMLQKMFPKNEEKVPEVRFPGFDGEWEKRKFGDLGSVAMCKRVFKEQTTSVGEIPFYKIGTFGAEPDAFISRELFEEYKSNFQYPNVGDMLISASGTIGRTVEYSGEEAYFQDSNIVWFKHDDRIDNSFLRCIYNIVKWNGIEGSTIKRLYNDNFLKTEFYIPTAGEQAKIGTYFRSLDRLIALQQKKIESLKEFKKGCLQQMFV